MRKSIVAPFVVVLLLAWANPASSTVAAGSTWYSDGTKSKTVHAGDTIKAYATGAVPGVPYQLVIAYPHPDPIHATHPCYGPLAQLVNPTIVYAGPSGLIGSVRGAVTHNVPGVYELCFLDSSPDKFTATAGGIITVAA